MLKDFPQEAILPPKTIFRKGSVLELAKESFEFGSKGIIVHGRSLLTSGLKEKLRKQFTAGQVIDFFCHKPQEPTNDEVAKLIKEAKKMGAGWLAGIGGGSVLDLAKAAAGLYKAKKSPSFYQEGGKLEEPGIPFITVPTTAGSGSEATPNAVIINAARKVKLSIRDKSFMAKVIILDEELLMGMPEDVAAYAAMDAFTHACESYFSKNSTWFSDTLALRAVKLINDNISEGCLSGSAKPRRQLLLGSYFAGIALANARLGVIHGIAHPLGALYGVRHGLVCAVCFLPSLKINRDAVRDKYDLVSGLIKTDLTARVGELNKQLGIKSPFSDKKVIDKELIINQTLSSGSTAANPKTIERKDVEFIIEEIFS